LQRLLAFFASECGASLSTFVEPMIERVDQNQQTQQSSCDVNDENCKCDHQIGGLGPASPLRVAWHFLSVEPKKTQSVERYLMRFRDGFPVPRSF
jgi:hypothetical protein